MCLPISKIYNEFILTTSLAEIDFLIQHKNEIIPIEVKAEEKKRKVEKLKSICRKVFTKNCPTHFYEYV